MSNRASLSYVLTCTAIVQACLDSHQPYMDTTEQEEHDFHAGWNEWCCLGYVDCATLRVFGEDGVERPCSQAFADGYQAAADDNEHGCGERPRAGGSL